MMRGRYDTPFRLDDNSTSGKLLSYVKEGARVLECGPANGNWTKYLKNDKKCTVDIVEYDENFGKDAAEFANITCIGSTDGDLNGDRWLEVLGGDAAKGRYDVILFADVLEHLMWPNKVLEKCRPLLKDDGIVLISLPNIGHMSVMWELYFGMFNYEKIGLVR